MSVINNKLLQLMARLQSAELNGVKREEGQGLVEYALILAIISIAAIATMGILSGKINSVFTTVTGALGS
ncbi:MAG TPA: Flp family type IVb pilin [Dehalococcoidia bacterium]|nr:Flp family type IVb pilin [Dehalococcoidia bacterium]